MDLFCFCIIFFLGHIVLKFFSFCSSLSAWLGLGTKRQKLFTGHLTVVCLENKMALHRSLSELEHKCKCRESASVYLNRKFFRIIFFRKCFQTIWQQNDNVNWNAFPHWICKHEESLKKFWGDLDWKQCNSFKNNGSIK